MKPVYVGDCSIEEVPGSKLSQKRGQAAVLTRLFEGQADDLPAFLAAYPILSVDSELPSMVLDQYDVEYDGPEVKVTLTYYGLPSVLGSKSADLQSDVEWFPQSVILGTDNPSDGLWIVNYSAPTVTYRYSVASRLSDPQYENLSEYPSDIVIRDAAQYIAGGGPPNPNFVRQGKFLYQALAVCTGFRRNQKGTIYDYQESWSVVIQQPQAQSCGTFSVGGVSSPSKL